MGRVGSKLGIEVENELWMMRLISGSLLEEGWRGVESLVVENEQKNE